MEILLGRLLLGAARQSSARVCARLGERGHAARLSHSALLTNLDEEGTRLTTLAERAAMSKQAMSVQAREMEAAGYIERAVDASDARAVLVRPTARGRELIADMQSEMSAVEAELRAQFSEEEMEIMRRMLTALAQAD